MANNMYENIKSSEPANTNWLKPVMFYIGIALDFVGVVLFIAGMASGNWLVFDANHPNASSIDRSRLLTNFGPWIACNEGGFCGDPWVIVGGLDKLAVQLTQTGFVVASVTYAFGLIIVSLQVYSSLSDRMGVNTYFRDRMVAEVILPVAAVMAFVAILLMGHIKSHVIVHRLHSQHNGVGFWFSLIGVLLTVAGVMATVLNRRITHRDSGLVRHLHTVQKWKKQQDPRNKDNPRQHADSDEADNDDDTQALLGHTRTPGHTS